MTFFAVSVISLVLMVLDITNTKTYSVAIMVEYADDFSAAGSISSLKYWWDTLWELGPKFNYFPEPAKSWLTVKSNCSDKAVQIFKNTNIQITTQGKRHLDAALGRSKLRDEYIMEKINTIWNNPLKHISTDRRYFYCIFTTHIMSVCKKKISTSTAYSCRENFFVKFHHLMKKKK